MNNPLLTATRLLLARRSLAALALLASPLYAQDDTGLPSGDLEEIVVVGIFEESDRVTGSAHRVDQQLLETFRHDDINRVLNFIPGVYAREEDGFGLRPNIGLRGGSADRSQKVTLMEDGVLFAPAPYSAPAAYVFPITSRIVNVEVYKGPSSVEFGPQTIGGAINLVSAPIPSSPAFEAALGGGSDGYRSAHLRAGNRFDRTGVLAEYVHIASDGFKSLDQGGDTGFSKNELMLKADREFDVGTLELRLGYADEVSNETYLGLTDADLRSRPHRRYQASELDRMDWELATGRASWNQQLWGASFTATGYIQRFDRAWRKFNNFSGADIREVLANPEGPFNQVFVDILRGTNTDGFGGTVDDIRIGTNDRSFLSGGSQGTFAWEFAGRFEHRLTLGARYHYDRIDRLHDELGYEQTSGTIVRNAQSRTVTTVNSAETDAIALWIRDEINLNDRWMVVPGLRIESISNDFENELAGSSTGNDYVIVLPGIGARVAVTEEFTLLAGAHKGFSPAIPSPSGSLEAEEAINYELGGQWQGSLGRLELIGYYSDYSNLTAICTVASGCAATNLDSQTNAGEVETRGIEAGWSHDFETGSFTVPVMFTYTFTDAEFGEAFSSSNPQFGDVIPGDELPYIPPHRANASIGLNGSRWGAHASITYTERMRDQAGRGSFNSSEGSDASTVLDLAVHFDVGQSWTLSGRIDNVTDEVDVVSRRPFGARPMKPRTVRLEARYQLPQGR